MGLLDEIISWIEIEIFAIQNLISLGILVILVGIIYLFKNKIRDKGRLILNSVPFNLPPGWPAFWDEISYRFGLTVFILFYNLIAAVLNLPAALTLIAGYLLVAWLIIRTITWLLPTTIWVRLISYLIWIIAVLNIIGLYDLFVDFLEDLEINLGDFQLSLMMIIRGVVVLGIFFWIASWSEKYFRKRLQKSKSLTPSVRVLVQKTVRVILYAAALIMALSSIGIDLSAFAFLGGAIGVGLGFGLQTIVSNFISGIIIILDKSIKPGDVIEIGDVFGTVISLNTRFVSVVTLAGKEYLIPNESFITNEVINWSYSDDLVRLDTTVGVGYDSDLKQVQDLILQAMNDHERIIRDPKPVCLLKEFGDNTVDFELRFWISDPSMGVANIKSEVLMDVWDLLAENDVNIAFPQRDLHFESFSAEAVESLKEIFNKSANQDSSDS